MVASNAPQGAKHQLANSEHTKQNAVLHSRNCAETSVSVIAEDWTEEEERGERRGEIQVSRREEWPCDIKG